MVHFLLLGLPSKKGYVTFPYREDEIDDACADQNVSRYLSQYRSNRPTVLSFMYCGHIHGYSRHQYVEIFRAIGLRGFEFGKPFKTTWPAQLALIERYLYVFLLS